MGLFSWLFGRRPAVRTRIDPTYLPPELHYIIPLAEIHGSDARVNLFDPKLDRHVTYASKLEAADIDALRTLYIQLRENDHGMRISRWAQEEAESYPSGTPWPVVGLLFLFEELGELGIAPFNDGVVRYIEIRKEPNWNNLPASLRYLAGPAEVFGTIQFEDRILDFLRNRMTADEKSELQELVRKYRQDQKEINHWIDEKGMTKHPEAALVYFTGLLLNIGEEAGLL